MYFRLGVFTNYSKLKISRPSLLEMDTPLVSCLRPNTDTQAHGIPLFPIHPQLSMASRFQSGLSQQTERIIYAGRDKETSKRERHVFVCL